MRDRRDRLPHRRAALVPRAGPYEFPAADALPIVYWACRLEGGASPELARRFLDFLAGAETQAIVRRHGFEPWRGDG